MNKMKWVPFLIIASLQALAANAFATTEDPGDVSVYSAGSEAELIEPVYPTYPRSARRRGIEGWVVLGFRINELGETERVIILDQSIDDIFEKSAISAIEQRRYRPATQNGEPIPQERNSVRLLFNLGRGAEQGVSRQFAVGYGNALDAIVEGDLQDAGERIEKLEGRKTNSLLVEVAYLDYLKGLYWQKKGDPIKALRHYSRSLTISEFLPDEIHVNLLRFAMSLSLEFKHYLDFLELYEELKQVDSDLAHNDDIHRVAQQVEAFLRGDSPFAVGGEISSQCRTCEREAYFWSHELARPSFLIHEVKGEITSINLRCGFKVVSLEYEPNMVWTSNKEWGDCNVEVQGTQGTSFKLVEVQNANSLTGSE